MYLCVGRSLERDLQKAQNKITALTLNGAQNSLIFILVGILTSSALNFPGRQLQKQVDRHSARATKLQQELETAQHENMEVISDTAVEWSVTYS